METVREKKTSRKRKRFWVTTTMAEGREELLTSTFREFLLYLVCLVLISVYLFGQASDAKYYLTSAMRGQFADEAVFGDIKSAQDVWTVKVKNDSCEIHGFFRRHFLSCYNRFDAVYEDTESFGPAPLTPGFTHSDAVETGSLRGRGVGGSIYSGGGFYVDLPAEEVLARTVIADLKGNLWITRGTRAVFVDFAVYNGNLNLFCVCKLSFEFPPSGGVVAGASFNAARLTSLDGRREWALRVVLYAFAACMLYYTLEEVREIIYFGTEYLAQFWNYVDLFIILLTYFYVAATEYLRVAAPARVRQIIANPHVYGNLEHAGYVDGMVETSGAVLAFLVYMKVFKFLNFNRRMAQLNNTLSQCAKDVAGFSVMFFIAFLAYAELGYLVFGSQVRDFSTFGDAMFTLLRTVLGDFNYMDIHEANWVVAPVYFLTYMVLVFFVLLNMFLAIINDTYGDVKTDIAIAPKEIQMTEFLKRKLFRLLSRFGFRKGTDDVRDREFDATIDDIRNALRRCGFTDREIEMYFARYRIESVGDVAEEVIDKFFEEFAREEEESKKATAADYVRAKDFLGQTEQLERLERGVVELARRVRDLLTAVEGVQK
ncbi:polycystin-2-like isoform X2 [Cylas formicarius]|uniref:polycystin-2-like isoform X2 n=1 Tax=Cylas formicarius TaxID=197179 RepID=UPI002958A4E7|nr:polycystin-2-like isoform X2 [Cylas formicarius]